MENIYIFFFILNEMLLKRNLEYLLNVPLGENCFRKVPCPFTFVRFLVGYTASHSRFTKEVRLESSDSLTSQLDNAKKRQ